MSTPSCGDAPSLADARVDLTKLRAIIQGADTEVVETEGGTLRTLAGQLAAILALYDPQPFATTAALTAALAGLDRGKFVVDEEIEQLYVVTGDGSGGNALKPLIDLAALDTLTDRRLDELESVNDNPLPSVYDRNGNLIVLHNGNAALIDQPFGELPRYHGTVAGADVMPLTANGEQPLSAVNDGVVAAIDVTTGALIVPDAEDDQPFYEVEDDPELGKKNLYAMVKRNGVWAKEKLTYSQEEDITHRRDASGGRAKLLRTKTFSTSRVEGMFKPYSTLKPGAGFADIVYFTGQSVGVGTTHDGGYLYTATLNPPRANILMPWAGYQAHENKQNNDSINTAIPPARWSRLVPGQESKRYSSDGGNLIDSPGKTETMVSGYLNQVVASYDSDALFIGWNGSSGGAGMSTTIGTASLKGQPLQNFEAFLTDMVAASNAPQPVVGLEALWGRQVRVHSVVVQGHESHQSDTKAETVAALTNLFQRADDFVAITGQADIPMVILCPPASAKGNNSTAETNRFTRHCEEVVREGYRRRDKIAVVPQYMMVGGRYQIPSSYYHPEGENQQHMGLRAGIVANDLERNKIHEHIHTTSAKMIDANTVKVWLNDAVEIDTDHIYESPGYGYEVVTSAGVETIDEVIIAPNGYSALLKLAGTPGENPVLLTGTGLDPLYPFQSDPLKSNRPIGNQFGYRMQIRARRVTHYTVLGDADYRHHVFQNPIPIAA